MLSFTDQRSLSPAGSVPAASSSPASSTATQYLETVWREACDELSAPVARGTVTHEVDISLVNGPDGGVRTKYSVSLDASITSQFLLTRRVGEPARHEIDRWGRKFADVVAVTTGDPQTVRTYFTGERRSVTIQLLQRFPTATISNRELTVSEHGTDPAHDNVVAKLGLLVDAATMLQPMWADAALDECSVIEDLFGSDRDLASMSHRFEDLYQGSIVRWTGEAVQVGEAGHRERWAAILVGSADGHTTASGRVVAMAAIDPEADMKRGDVVSFEGMLVNLDAQKRYLRIA